MKKLSKDCFCDQIKKQCQYKFLIDSFGCRKRFWSILNMSGKGSPYRMSKSPNSPKSPKLPKPGPMKATIPMSSLVKQSTSLKSSSSTVLPEVQPANLYQNISPVLSTGHISPGSSSCKGEPRAGTGSSCGSIRRTSSLDAIHLRGQSPKDFFYWRLGTLHIDRATQTDESNNPEEMKRSISHNSEILSAKPIIRATKDSGEINDFPEDDTLCNSSQTISSPRIKAVPIYVPYIMPRTSARSSEEGLNQEIERIVLRDGGGDAPPRGAPGRPAGPLAELLSHSGSRSVNTQTPKEIDGRSYSSEDSSSPDQDASKPGTSPKLNEFSAGSPPDGCERVRSKALEDAGAAAQPPHSPQPPPPNFQLRPSVGSAFECPRPRPPPPTPPHAPFGEE